MSLARFVSAEYLEIAQSIRRENIQYFQKTLTNHMLWENKGLFFFFLLAVRQLWNTFACVHLAGNWPFSERSRATLAKKEWLWRQKGWHSWTGNCSAVPTSTLDATQQNWLLNAYFSNDSQSVGSLSISPFPELCDELNEK